jgi:hypothetical protein
MATPSIIHFYKNVKGVANEPLAIEGVAFEPLRSLDFSQIHEGVVIETPRFSIRICV